MIRATIVFWYMIFAGNALAFESAYTKLDLEKDCVFHSGYEQGGGAYCEGYKGYPVHFSEGDLRQMVRFGHIAILDAQWESFSQFNHIGETIEWRIADKKPFAAILRWLISNADENGEYLETLQGQVLVISTVADHNNPQSCVVAYVDTLVNKDANAIARDVADRLAPDFKCGKDQPEYHGAQGPLSGEPGNYFE
ncbi:MAG: hypothetical protein AAF217_07810 [Pseudomonadota bacterium]